MFASIIFISFSFNIAYANGNGFNPLIWLYTSSAVLLKSIFSSSLVMLYPNVTSSSFCLILSFFCSNINGNVSFSNSVPILDNLSWSVPTFSFSLIVISFCDIMSPASILELMYIIVMPVFLYPSIIAWWMGAPPLSFGNSEACTFIAPYFGVSINSFGIIWPYAQVIMMSGFFSKMYL